MTAFDRFDPFERRITDAIEQIAAARRPVYLDDILQLTARSRQRPRWAFPERLRPMSRLAYAAAAAVFIAIFAGGVLLLRPSSNVGPPSPPPSASAVPAETPALPMPLRSTWLAPTNPAATPGVGNPFTKLVVTADGGRLSVIRDGVETFMSEAGGFLASELDVVSVGTAGGCQIGDRGHYGFAFGTDGAVPASDGTLMSLAELTGSPLWGASPETCRARAAVLQRTWVHAIDADSNGGRGIATSFDPMFLITLPQAPSGAQPGPDALMLGQPDGSLTVVRNPLGFVVPNCSLTGDKRPIDPTIAAWTAYLRTFPGFTVETSQLRVDGHPAMLLTIPTTLTAECPFHRVKVWFTADGTTFGWDVQQGDTDVMGLVEVDGSLFLFQWYPSGVARDEAQAALIRDQLQTLLATVRFTDSLPQ